MATGENTFSSGITGGSQGYSTVAIDVTDVAEDALSEKESERDSPALRMSWPLFHSLH